MSARALLSVLASDLAASCSARGGNVHLQNRAWQRLPRRPVHRAHHGGPVCNDRTRLPRRRRPTGRAAAPGRARLCNCNRIQLNFQFSPLLIRPVIRAAEATERFLQRPVQRAGPVSGFYCSGGPVHLASVYLLLSLLTFHLEQARYCFRALSLCDCLPPHQSLDFFIFTVSPDLKRLLISESTLIMTRACFHSN